MASEEFIDTEKRKREKVYQGWSFGAAMFGSAVFWSELNVKTVKRVFAARSIKGTGIGRLLVTILEATELKAAKPNGESPSPHLPASRSCSPYRLVVFLCFLQVKATRTAR